jgi:hypothetical protein
MPVEGKKPPPLVIALLMSPIGIWIVVLGWWIGHTGELSGRGGAKMPLDPPWDWVLGGGFIVLGMLILATPAYYYWRGTR